MLRSLPVGFWIIVLGALVAANISIYQTISTLPALEVSVLEVGKGHATLVRSPLGKRLLIDTGTDASVLRALGGALPMWERSFDTIILTSASTKAAGGLPDVQNRYHIANIIRFGAGSNIPYGAPLTFDDVSIVVIAPGTFDISYGATSLAISSSTSPGTYRSDGISIAK